MYHMIAYMNRAYQTMYSYVDMYSYIMLYKYSENLTLFQRPTFFENMQRQINIYKREVKRCMYRGHIATLSYVHMNSYNVL